MNINIGCGYHTGKSWVNYDVTPTARIQKIPFIGKFLVKKSERFPDEVIYGDIRKKPLSKLGEANNIYCSHTLEHMCLEDMRLALKNIFMMLRNGGSFRLIVPSLESRINNYNNDKDANKFIREIGMGKEFMNKGLVNKLRQIIGSSNHLWMYDHKNMFDELNKFEFSKIRKCKFGDSKIDAYIQVEDKTRFIDEKGNEEIAFHCIK